MINHVIHMILFLEKKLKETPKLFPLLPEVPRVSDVLAWLAALSLKISREKETEAIKIEGFHYRLLKRPDQSHQREKYQVQVELEFSAPSATIAREFHDLLITPNRFINLNREVAWSSSRGKWRTHFFLKDRTFYPSLEGDSR